MPKKICITTGNFPVRSETFVTEHAVGLARLGHDVLVVSQAIGTGITSKEIEMIDASGVQRIYIPSYTNNRVGNLLRMVRRLLRRPRLLKFVFHKWPWTRREHFLADGYLETISKVQPDVVHVHFGSSAAAMCRLGLHENTIITWHGSEANVLPKSRGEDMYRELFLASHRHTVGSQFMMDRLIQLGCPQDKITRIPMGVDLERFTYVDRRDRDGCVLRIISVGRLDEEKGHHYLIDAVTKLFTDNVSVRLRIVGEGSLRNELEAQIVSCGAEDYIELLGALDSASVRQELEKGDLFVLAGVEAASGRVETQGVVLIEAQSTGLPVVASAVGGVPDSLIDGVTGMLCEPKNVDSLVHAIKFYAESKEMRLEHGRAACEFVEKRFSLPKMLEAFEALYAVE